MSANIKASVDGTQAIIGVGGVDQMTVSNAGVVTANSFVGAISGNASSATALATGSTTARTLANRFADVVNVKDFGAVGDGVTDDRNAIQAAIDSLGGRGGIVQLANNGKYLIGSDLTVRVNVCLNGAWINPDVKGAQNAQTFSDAGSCIRLVSSATIRMAQCSSLTNMLIYRNGMTFPVENGTGYAGTAITAAGNSVALKNLLVMGFDKLFYGTGQRHVIDRVFGDNNNGIEITASPDVCYISNCHMWPFASDATIYPSNGVNRSGIAYYSHDIADWVKFTNCFTYGYKTGFKIYNANSNTLIGCGSDQNFDSGSATYTDSIGFHIIGNCNDTKLIGCQSAANWYGVQINTSASQTTFIDSLSTWYSKNIGIHVVTGDASISGGIIRNTDIGIASNSASSIIHVANVKFNDITIKPIYSSVVNNIIFVSECDFGNYASVTEGPIGGGTTAKILASFDPLVIPMTGNVFRVSGTTSFGSLRWGWMGREVTLIFEGTLTVYNGIATNQNMRLSSAANFSATPRTSLTLKHDGVQWFETGRSA